jgi:hypothetical protein
MKTTKFFIISAAILGLFAISSFSTESSAVRSAEPAAIVQCGVSNAAIKEYLETCSHHHTVYNVWDVPGTCNSKATIENCYTATVYVSDGIVIGHMDASGICE